MTESSIIRRDGQVTDNMEDVSTPNGIAGHHGHHGFGKTANLFLDIQNIEPRHPITPDIATLSPHLLVSTRAEGLFSLAGENDDSDRAILTAVLKGILQFIHCLGPEGIAHFGPVDRDLSDPVLRLLKLQIVVVFDFVPDRFCHKEENATTSGLMPARRRPKLDVGT